MMNVDQTARERATTKIGKELTDGARTVQYARPRRARGRKRERPNRRRGGRTSCVACPADKASTDRYQTTNDARVDAMAVALLVWQPRTL